MMKDGRVRCTRHTVGKSLGGGAGDSSAGLPLLRVAVMRELLDVVDQAEKLPLGVDFACSAQGEAIEALVVAEIAEDRLHRRKALTVAGATSGRIDALLHSIAVPLRWDHHLAMEERDLARLGLLGRAQATCPMRARHAVALRALKTHH